MAKTDEGGPQDRVPLTEAELDWCLYAHRLDPLAIRLVHEVREARRLLGAALEWAAVGRSLPADLYHEARAFLGNAAQRPPK